MRVLITSDVIWCDTYRFLCDWFNKFYSFSITLTLAIDNVDECGLNNTTCHKWLPKKTKIANAVLAMEGLPDGSNKMEHFIYKGEWTNAYQCI